MVVGLVDRGLGPDHGRPLPFSLTAVVVGAGPGRLPGFTTGALPGVLACGATVVSGVGTVVTGTVVSGVGTVVWGTVVTGGTVVDGARRLGGAGTIAGLLRALRSRPTIAVSQQRTAAWGAGTTRVSLRPFDSVVTLEPGISMVMVIGALTPVVTAEHSST